MIYEYAIMSVSNARKTENNATLIPSQTQTIAVTETQTGVLNADLASTLLVAATPLLLPDNSAARVIAVSVIPSAADALEKRALDKELRKPG